jgi:electron transfer flavoprotein alpha subunit
MSEQKRIKRPRGRARLLEGKCIACGARCQSACPVDCIEMDAQGEPIITADKCIGCLKCVKICPAEALEMAFTPEELAILQELDSQKVQDAAEAEEIDPEEARLRELLAAYRNVWVYIEQTEGEAARVSWELLGTGARLAKNLGVELCAVIIGQRVEHLCAEAFVHGANRAYLLDAPVYEHYRTQPYNDAVCHLVKRYKPEIILTGATGVG